MEQLLSVTFGYFRLLSVTFGYLRLLAVTCGYLRLLAVTCGYLRLLAVTFGYLRLLAVACGYLRLLAVTCGYLKNIRTDIKTTFIFYIMNALIGHTGYVGSYLKTKLKNIELYNSKNIENIKHQSFDVVYFCGLPATKWLINKNPQADLENMLAIQKLLETCSINRFVLVSTIDVYDKMFLQQTEDDDGMFTKETYGKHRRMMEEWVIENYANHHVIRLPALFGIGLKKNALYDLLTDNKAIKINPADVFQWYYLDDLHDDILFAIHNNISCINLFPQPISMKVILEKVFVNENFVSLGEGIKYDFRTKYSVTTYFRDSFYIIEKMQEFVQLWKALRNHDKLVVSNLCWIDEEQSINILNRYGINNIELALTKYYSWNKIDTQNILNKFKGFNIYSLQALFYGVSYNLFIEEDKFIEHFALVAKLSKTLGVKRLVFGSPFNRRVPSDMSDQEAKTKFVNVFKKVSDLFPEDIVVCIEHNALQYNCNFITLIDEAVEIVQLVDRKNIKVNFDTGNAIMMGESCRIKETVKEHIGHIQISAPFLESIQNINLGSTFQYVANSKISLEARELNNFEEELKVFVTLATLPSQLLP